MATLGATTIEGGAAGLATNQQVVSTDTKSNADFTLTSSSAQEINISKITITPSVATSRIWICYAIQNHINMLSYTSARTAKMSLHRYIGSTDTDIGGIISMRAMVSTNDYSEHSSVVGRIDHPNTTSAVRYSMYTGNHDTSGIVYWQHSYAGISHGLRGFAMELIGTPESWER